MSDITKAPRLYLDAPMAEGRTIEAPDGAAHYLRNVMRLGAGAPLRLFNGRDGEFAARIDAIGKKAALLSVETHLRPQLAERRRRRLYFAPLKKDRMDFLVEKAVELGATDLHPVLSERADVRKLNAERVRAQIVEAAEQCERLDMPVLHDIADLRAALSITKHTVFAAIERDASLNRMIRPEKPDDYGFLVGPPGGFSADEITWLKSRETIRSVSLGDAILRAETAALAGLAVLSIPYGSSQSATTT